ncbi:hypothetical protein FGG08_006302, partial [Glutinoglossum americanum]
MEGSLELFLIRDPLLSRPIRSDIISILQYHPEFETLTGGSPLCTLLEKQPAVPLFHEACIYIPDRDELYITSNLLKQTNESEQIIIISHITFRRNNAGDIVSRQFEKIKPGNFAMPNGGVNYRDNVLFCVQGDCGSTPGGIYYLEQGAASATALITNYHGRPFNSPNDVVVSNKDGGIWFTDPVYGFEQGFRPPPQLPSQVYRFDPITGDIRVVADGFGRPNGICFSPDESIMYITDTDWIHGNGEKINTRASTIYAFDIIFRSSSPFLTNRRVFAMADTGAPDGIKCDTSGNIYSGCGDGINVWNAGGVLIGKILVPGGVANFCFGRK